MFTEYINILSECSKDIIKKMANIDIADVEIIKDEQLEALYSIAHSVKYEDSDDKVKGEFILGFVNETEVISVASKIAESVGLAPIQQFDETAEDIICEFLNTIIGNTVSAWDKKGLNVRFEPPVLVKDKSINLKEMPNTEVHLIKFKFPPNLQMRDSTDLSLVVTFSMSSKSKLMGKRILVVDDSRVMRIIIAKTLEKLGINVEQAVDGKEAIEKYKNIKPDLTIMDLVMPKMGGLDAIIEIQELDPEAKFVILTSSSRKDEVVTARTLKVLAYIIKPLKLEEFLVTIKDIFEK